MPAEVYDQVPVEARDLERPGWVHWVVDPGTADDFFEGAYWAFGWTFDRFFGELLGPELLQLATDTEELQAGGWVPVSV